MRVFSRLSSRGDLQGRGVNNLRANLIQRQNLVRQTVASHKTWHAPNHAAGFILYVDAGTRSTQRFATFQSVPSHAGENHGERSCAEDRSNRVEKHIHRWAAKIFLRSTVRLQENDAVLPVDHHVKVSRSNDNTPGHKRFTGNTFANR